jgi:hypothetical protein
MTDKLQEIFDAQIRLGKHFLIIEKNNSLAHESDDIEPLTLPGFYSESRLRAAAWRIVEEASELAIAPYPDKLEEASDILHFLTEFSILSGVFPNQISLEYAMEYVFDRGYSGSLLTYPFDYLWKDFIVQLGVAVNHLKNRPWKMTLKPIDVREYRTQVCLIWCRFGEVCSILGFNGDQLYKAYFAKHQKNEERISNGI